MSKQLSVRLWDENARGIEALQKAHARWLKKAVKDEPGLAGMEAWSATDIINNALADYLERTIANYEAQK